MILRFVNHRITESPNPRIPNSREFDTDVLHLRVTRQRLQALLSSVSALLVPAERQLDAAAGAVRVDVDLTGLDARRERHRLVDVARPDAGHETVLTAVRDRRGFFQIV